MMLFHQKLLKVNNKSEKPFFKKADALALALFGAHARCCTHPPPHCPTDLEIPLQRKQKPIAPFTHLHTESIFQTHMS